MPFAATLLLDAVGAAPVRAMWQALAEAGLARDALDLGYAPHLTLGVWEDGAPAARLETALAHYAAIWQPMALRFAGFGVFPGEVLYLAPVVMHALLACHAALHAALPDIAPHPHYAPGAWVPHVTLAGRVAAAMALPVVAPLLPEGAGGRLERLELVRFPPVAALGSWVLGA